MKEGRGKLAGGDFSEKPWQPHHCSRMTASRTMSHNNCGLRRDYKLGLMAALPTEWESGLVLFSEFQAGAITCLGGT